MDDDIFALDNVEDALSWFLEADLVFSPDANSETLDQAIWQGVFDHASLNRTAALNTGLYWIRRRHEPRRIAQLLARGGHTLSANWAWEQGFFANLYADQTGLRLPPQRYFYISIHISRDCLAAFKGTITHLIHAVLQACILAVR